MKSTKYLWVVFMIFMVSCASVRAPHGSVPSREKVKTDAFGGWIGVTDSSKVLIQGELIAMSADSVYLLNKDGFRGVAKSAIVSARLIIYNTSEGGYALWTFVGTLFTLTNGTFAVLTLPAMLISGIASTSTEAKRINYVDYPANNWKLLGRYARFPQGLPSDVEPSLLTPRARGKR
jgi:hypothetical protein